MPTEKNLRFTVQGPQKTQTSWHLNCHAGHHSNSLHVNASRHKCSINGTKETEQNEIHEDLLQAPCDSSVQELHPSGEVPSGDFCHFLFGFSLALCVLEHRPSSLKFVSSKVRGGFFFFFTTTNGCYFNFILHLSELNVFLLLKFNFCDCW